ncbi:WXG100 family type VII secretion target [Saccharopolyspora sp. NPDC047091]|uniref:WXG100 family type VII secretion target n=1 Tax=Saccharopolyspora sp. NPDC047091 TaxID=3155924 RepID=UPI003400B459
MAQQVQTSTPGMQSAGQKFSDTASDFTRDMHAVNTMMATLQSSWHGDASRNFNQAMDNWEKSFNIVINKLIGMMEVMGINSKDYVTAEDDATSKAGSFSSVLPLPGV